MRVSQNEVYRVAQRALEALGAPHGVDTDGAGAVAWLEARGLPGVALLAMALGRLAGAFEPLTPPYRAEQEAVVDLAGRPAIAWAGSLVDGLDVLAGAGGRLRLKACRWPLFLLPAAGRGRGLRLRWPVGTGTVACSADPAGGCRIVGEGLAGSLDAALRDDGPADVVLVTSTSTVRAAERSEVAQVLDAAALDERLGRTLAEGIEVEAAAWAAASAMARRVLVPASEQSRLRGAGGGDANA